MMEQPHDMGAPNAYWGRKFGMITSAPNGAYRIGKG
jgi:hypothetical protein